MPDKEKTDMLIEQLVVLYRIRAAGTEKNKVLEYEISVTEGRLQAMGITDLSKFKPE